MEANSADIVICDPYNIGKDFGNDSDKQERLTSILTGAMNGFVEAIRILKPHGTLYIYGFSEILAFIRVRIHINVRWIVWHYTNKVVPGLNFWQRAHMKAFCAAIRRNLSLIVMKFVNLIPKPF